MFGFQNFTAYKKARELYILILAINSNKSIHLSTRDQLHRSSMSALLNIAEGSGRNTSKDRRRFFNIARSSLFECAAVLDLLEASGEIDEELYLKLSALADETSRILFATIKGNRTEI